MRRKKRNFEQEIAEIEAKLKKKMEDVKNLQSKLAMVKSERDSEINQALATVMKEKNLSISDVVRLIEEKAD